MTADETLSDFYVPGTTYAYFLGCFERRVTIYSQQVRALNLAEALISAGRVSTGARVAVIGGGVAGVTLAAALAAGECEAKEIVLFEKKSELLHLQRPGRDRYIHPHIYDWPDDRARDAQAGLPILDWTAGSAEEVALQILDGFNEIQRKYPSIKSRVGCTVNKVAEMPRWGCTVHLEDDDRDNGIFDVVVLAIGFGYERYVGEHVPSYWASSILRSSIPSPEAKHQFFISGNGDGGLVDFAMAVLGREHQTIVKFVTEFRGLDDVKRELMQIEEEAWRAGDSFDLLSEYENRIVLPAPLALRLYEQFRPNDTFVLHTRAAKLFRRDTSVLNRFVVFSLIQADQEKKKIQVICGKDFENSVVPLTGPVQLADGENIDPDYRFLRLGPDQPTVLAPFEKYAAAFCSSPRKLVQEYRPATPQLNESAERLFGKYRQRTVLKNATVTQKSPDHTESVSISAKTVVQEQLAAMTERHLASGGNPAQVNTTPTFTVPALGPLTWRYAAIPAHSNFAYNSTNKSAFAATTLIRTADDSKKVVDSQNSVQEGSGCALDAITDANTSTREVVQARVIDLIRWAREAMQTLEMKTAFRLAAELENTVELNLANLSKGSLYETYMLLVEIEIRRSEKEGSIALERVKEFLNKAQNV